MTFTHRELSKSELIEHVAKHESAYVQRYVAALYAERDELEEQLQNIRRVGFSRGGKAALFRIGRYALFFSVIVIAFVWGFHFGAAR
jgi:hypothetical protein